MSENMKNIVNKISEEKFKIKYFVKEIMDNKDELTIKYKRLLSELDKIKFSITNSINNSSNKENKLKKLNTINNKKRKKLFITGNNLKPKKTNNLIQLESKKFYNAQIDYIKFDFELNKFKKKYKNFSEVKQQIDKIYNNIIENENNKLIQLNELEKELDEKLFLYDQTRNSKEQDLLLLEKLNKVDELELMKLQYKSNIVQVFCSKSASILSGFAINSLGEKSSYGIINLINNIIR